MSSWDSRWSRFYIDDVNGVERNLTAYITELIGLPGRRTLVEVTSLTSSGGRAWVPNLEEVPFDIVGFFDNTATSGPDVVLGALRTNGTSVDFRYRVVTDVDGFSQGFIEYAGTCWVEDYIVVSRVGKIVQFAARMKVQAAAVAGTTSVVRTSEIFSEVLTPKITTSLGESPDVGPEILPVVLDPVTSIGESPDVGPQIQGPITITTTVTDV